MKARVKWAEARRFIEGSGAGHRVIIDASATPEGETTFAPPPMEMLLPGMGGCTVEEVASVLEAVRTDEPPKAFTKIHESFSITGDVPLEKAEEAMSLTGDKYSSAYRTPEETAEITDQIKVIAGKS